MSDDVVNLARARADRSGDCRDWSARDALVEMLRAVDDGMEIEVLYIAAQVKGEGNLVDQVWQCAGGTKMQLLGLLTRHVYLINRDADV